MSVCKELTKFFSEAFRAGEEVTFYNKKVYGFSCTSNRIWLDMQDRTKPLSTQKNDEIIRFKDDAFLSREIRVEGETITLHTTSNGETPLFFAARVEK